jgi:hypothetical protein
MFRRSFLISVIRRSVSASSLSGVATKCVSGQERGQRQDRGLRLRQHRQRRVQRNGQQPLEVGDDPGRQRGVVLQAGQSLGFEPVVQRGTRELAAPLG